MKTNRDSIKNFRATKEESRIIRAVVRKQGFKNFTELARFLLFDYCAGVDFADELIAVIEEDIKSVENRLEAIFAKYVQVDELVNQLTSEESDILNEAVDCLGVTQMDLLQLASSDFIEAHCATTGTPLHRLSAYPTSPESTSPTSSEPTLWELVTEPIEEAEVEAEAEVVVYDPAVETYKLDCLEIDSLRAELTELQQALYNVSVIDI